MKKTTHRSKPESGSPAKRGDHLELSPRVREMVDGLHELCDAIESGIPLEQAATVRPAPWRIKPPNLKAADVRAIRESLGLNPALFASFLGVRPATLRSWEQGETRPSPVGSWMRSAMTGITGWRNSGGGADRRPLPVKPAARDGTD